MNVLTGLVTRGQLAAEFVMGHYRFTFKFARTVKVTRKFTFEDYNCE